MAPKGTGEEKWELIRELALKMDLPEEKRIINFVQVEANSKSFKHFFKNFLAARQLREGRRLSSTVYATRASLQGGIRHCHTGNPSL